MIIDKTLISRKSEEKDFSNKKEALSFMKRNRKNNGSHIFLESLLKWFTLPNKKSQYTTRV